MPHRDRVPRCATWGRTKATRVLIGQLGREVNLCPRCFELRLAVQLERDRIARARLAT